MHSEGYTSENGQLNGLNNGSGDVLEHTENTRGVVEGSSTASFNNNGNKFQEVLQSKHGYNTYLLASKVPEMSKINNVENASSQALFGIMHKVLDDSIENKKEDIPDKVACLLKKIVQEIEHRNSRLAEDYRKQSNLHKSLDEKNYSRIRVLEAFAAGTTKENEVILNQLQCIKAEKMILEEQKKLDDGELVRLRKENEGRDLEISKLKQELEVTSDTCKKRCVELETRAMEIKAELEKKVTELESLLVESRKKVEDVEKFTESYILRWKKKEHDYKNFMDFQCGSLKELRMDSESIKQEILKTQQFYTEEITQLESKIKGLVDAAQNYQTVLAENRKLYNEVQDLKGNIRVYCRVRPFLKGESKKQTSIDYIGDNGEIVVTNPSKQGKENHRVFKFNKVFNQQATQEQVFLDTQPLIRSVLDGYDVCIFAYGQTGSGKTYTMIGPDASSPKDWGVNYRALNDLFNLSQTRRGSFEYQIGVQMVEIYNEQVRDLLSNGTTQKGLGIWSSTQPNGLAVPEASMYSVTSTSDVLELMNVGLMNRAVGSTALNQRSSRSHSVLSVHVCGTDLESDVVLRGNLHLVDLAGSERLDRTGATGDRLREAQHINKSLSALGDVMFALAQKSPHVPYRNSKLTQVLQSSLGGQAKTLMFIQLNPDADSFSETLSTLKFAERVSAIELGAARSHKEGRGVRELMEQVTSLKDSLAKKDEELAGLRLRKASSSNDLRKASSSNDLRKACSSNDLRKASSSGEKRNLGTPRHTSTSPRRHSIGGMRLHMIPPINRSLGLRPKAVSDIDNCSEFSDKQSHSSDEFIHHKDFFKQSRRATARGLSEDGESRLGFANVIDDLNDDFELLGLADADSEDRLSDISDGVLSMGTETDGSLGSIVEYTLFPELAKPPIEQPEKPNAPTKIPRPPQKTAASSQQQTQTASSSKRQGPMSPSPRKPPQAAPSRPSLTKGSSRILSSPNTKKLTSGTSPSAKSGIRRL